MGVEIMKVMRGFLSWALTSLLSLCLLICVVLGAEVLSRMYTWTKGDIPYIIGGHHVRHMHSYTARACLSNKTIVFIGDSLTRYQYLNLVHFLHTGEWESNYPRNENEHEWHNWTMFFAGTSARLGCNEYCDCFRNEHGHVKENRLYYDRRWNIKVYLFLWLPSDIPLKFESFPPFDIFHQQCYNSERLYSVFSPQPTYYKMYKAHEVIDFLTEVVKPLNSTHLFINQGRWPFPELQMSLSQLFIKTLINVSDNVYWKKTTVGLDGKIIADNPEFISNLLSSGGRIFDAERMTQGLAGEALAYWDGAHFQWFVYKELNSFMLLELCTQENK